MKKYIAVLELESDDEIIDANVSYIYSSNGTAYGAGGSVMFKEEKEDAKNKTYEDGLKEAWELARDIIAMPNSENKSLIGVRYNALGNDALYDIIRNYSASEIIKMIKEYEEIIVGDEVTNEEEWKGVVTWINPNGEYMEVMLEDGTTIQWKKTSFKKTGRHFSQIEEVLKQLKEDEDE